MAIEKLKSLPWFFQLLIFAAIAGVLVLAVEMLYFRDVASQIDAQQTQLAALRADLANMKEIEQRYRSFQQANARLEKQLAGLQGILPTTREGDVLLRQLQEIAARANIRVLRMEANPVSNKETTAGAAKAEASTQLYSEMSFRMELAGAYSGLGRFFDQVGHLQRIVNISNVVIASSANANKIQMKIKPPQALGDTVLATCTATTYFQPEP